MLMYGVWLARYEKNKVDNIGSGADRRLNFAEFQFRLMKGTSQAKPPAWSPTDDTWKTMDRKELADLFKKNDYAGRYQWRTIVSGEASVCDTICLMLVLTYRYSCSFHSYSFHLVLCVIRWDARPLRIYSSTEQRLKEELPKIIY
jgi:hypothetical protein